MMRISKITAPAAKLANSAKLRRFVAQTFAVFATFARGTLKSAFFAAVYQASERLR